MAQGKLKVKTKVPAGAKTKKKLKNTSAITKAKNKPVAPKKPKLKEIHNLKKIITKTVNKAVEEEIRSIASAEGKQNLSKVQKKVAEMNAAATKT